MKKTVCFLLLLALLVSNAVAEGGWVFFTAESSTVPEESTPVPAPTLAPTPEPTPELTPSPVTIRMGPLAKGDRGGDVRCLQSTLIELGYLDGSADGDFGARTETAVARAREMSGLEASGVADSEFLTLLYSGGVPYASGAPAALGPRVIRYGETSHLTEKSYNHPVSNVFDGRTDTAWAEGVSGYGIGEGITFTVATFGRDTVTLDILAGYHKSATRYRQNGRPKDITLTVDGRAYQYTLQDVMSPHTISVPGLSGKALVEFGITIDSVYKGNTWSDTCITEIEVY